MADQPTQEDIARWHRWFAAECNNRAWDLTSMESRTAADDRDMLYTAYASAFHWSKAGTPLHDARAEVTLAHVHALLGQAALSLHYAQRCLSFFETNECEDWDVAFAHAEMAHAAAASGDAGLHSRHYALAKEHGESIKDAEDRRVFLEELSRIPREVRARRPEGNGSGT